MCPWVGPHAPSFGRQLWGLPSRVEYVSPQGVLLPLVYGTTASPLWLELLSHSAWQATPSWTVHRLACHRLLPWLQVTFSNVPDAAWPGADQWPWTTAPATGPVGRLGRPSVSDPWGVGSLPVPRPPYVCAVSWASSLPFTGAPARCVALLVRCHGPVGSCSPVCPRGLFCCVCGVLGHLAPVHRCARLGVLCCVWVVSGHLAPVHRCARWVCCVARAVSWATWLLFSGVPARCVALRVRCPEPLSSSSPVCPLGVLCCVFGVVGHLAPVHRCGRVVCYVASAVSWATWLLFTGAPVRCVVLRVRWPGPLGFCSPVCPIGVLCCVCGVPGHLAPVLRCARSARCFARAVSWATGFLFTGVPAPFFVLLVRCPGPLGSRSPVCPLGVLLCVCGVLGHLSPVHRCARPWVPVPLLPSVHVRVRCPGPRGTCSPMCALCAVRVCRWWLCPFSSPPNVHFFFFLCGASFFFFSKKGGARTLQAQAGATGAAVQQCCVLWRVSLVLWWRPRPRGVARAS